MVKPQKKPSNCVTLRRFRETDLERIDSRIDILIPESDTLNMILTASSGHTYTITIEETPAAVFGIDMMWSGVAQVWAISSDLIRGHGIYYTKVCKEILVYFGMMYDIRRYHAVVNGGDVENIRWLYLLGFEYEFCMYNAAPDFSNVLGYVRWENKNVYRPKSPKDGLQKSVVELLGLA